MNKITPLLMGLLLIVTTTFGQEIDAKRIVKESNDLLLGRSSFSKMTMTIQRPEWSRTVSMQSWSLGNDFYLIYITRPVRDKGQVFMKRGKDMWNWLPSINRMIKIPPSMMMQSWMGSDFTNDDLVRANSIVNDYTHKLIGEETIEGLECFIIELIPLAEAPVVWGKIKMWISKTESYQLKSEFYNDYMELETTQLSTQIKQMGDRKLPSLFRMIKADNPDQMTQLKIEYQEFNISTIKENFFSQQNMKRLRPIK